MKKRITTYSVVILMLIAALAMESTHGKLHFLKHFERTTIWLPVLSSSLSGIVFIRIRNRNIYRARRTAPRVVQQLTYSFDGLATTSLSKGSFHVQSNCAG